MKLQGNVAMEELKIEDKTKYLLEVLKRIDSYVMSTNAKCAIIISYAAAVIAWVSVNLNKLVSDAQSPPLLILITIGIVGVIGSSIICLWMAVKVILPITTSSVEKDVGESVIFYGDIASTQKGAGGYENKVMSLASDTFLQDLSQQVFTLAKIANIKFEILKRLTLVLLYGNFISIAVLMIGLLMNSLVQRCAL
jgi:hypothetical protein